MENSVKKSGQAYVIMILLGIVLVALDFKVDTKISYGMVMGGNEGVSTFALTQAATVFVGMNLMLDVFFDPLGYLLIIIGFVLIKKANSGRESLRKRAMAMAGIGFLCYVGEILLPFVVDQRKLLLPLIVLYLAQVLAMAVIMYVLMRMYTYRIDNYKYMQVGKDLKFAVELYVVCRLVGNILHLFSRGGIYFAAILYYAVVAITVFAVVYYVVKSWQYMRMLDLFL